MKATIPKGAKKCPVCNLRKQIKGELSKIFRIKNKMLPDLMDKVVKVSISVSWIC